jgi:tetratricopeptide (TPR) repeat protein
MDITGWPPAAAKAVRTLAGRTVLLGQLIAARHAHQMAHRLWDRGEGAQAVTRASRAVKLLARRAQVAKRCGNAELAAALAALAYYDSELGNFSEAESRYQQALTELGACTEVEAQLRWVQLSIALADAQRRQAQLGAAEGTLRAAEVVAGEVEMPPELRSDLHNGMGVVNKDAGRYEAAAAHYAAALSLCPDDDVNRRATLQHNVAGLAHVQRQFKRAEQPAREALRLRESLPDPSPTAVAADATVLGAVLAGAGRHTEAAALFRRAHQFWLGRFGPDHYEVAVNLHNLASSHQAQGHPAQALAEFSEALRIKTLVLGAEHPEVAALANNLGALHAEQHRTDEARQHYTSAVAVLTRTLGPDHPFTRQCAANLDRLPAETIDR